VSEKSKMPEPKTTTNGKYKCPAENQEYDTREDYDAQCAEKHPDGM
jgi:hypothetical protein